VDLPILDLKKRSVGERLTKRRGLEYRILQYSLGGHMPLEKNHEKADKGDDGIEAWGGPRSRNDISSRVANRRNQG